MVAVVYGGRIYVSTNSGQTWQRSTAPPATWHRVASSADGGRLVAAAEKMGLYISTNSGFNWTRCENVSQSIVWRTVASSADGSKLAAAAYPGSIYTSTDSGAAWRVASDHRGMVGQWVAIKSSAD
eukprot:21533-Eustigmatos_ZCMA.PRE.1